MLDKKLTEYAEKFNENFPIFLMMGKSDEEIIRIVQKCLNDELKQGISRYALDNPSETLAEAFADVYANGKNAHPLSTEIRKLTVERYKHLKGGGVP